MSMAPVKLREACCAFLLLFSTAHALRLGTQASQLVEGHSQPYPLGWLRRNRPRGNRSDAATMHSACGTLWCGKLLKTLKMVLAQEMLDQVHLPGTVPMHHYAVVDEKCAKILQNVSLIQEAGVVVLGMEKVKVPDGIGLTGQQFSACASTRLFAPKLVPVRHIIYMDSDEYVVRSLRPLVDLMRRNKSTPMWMAPEVEDRNCLPGEDCGWYSHFSHHWFKAGGAGYNSGTLAINRYAWKELGLDNRVSDLMREAARHNFSFELADQDLLNIMAQKDGDLLGTLPCEFNQRTDSRCFDIPAENQTVEGDARFRTANGNASVSWYRLPTILHGNRKMFERQAQWERVAAKLEHVADTVLLAGARASDSPDLLALAGLNTTDLWWKPARKPLDFSYSSAWLLSHPGGAAILVALFSFLQS